MGEAVLGHTGGITRRPGSFSGRRGWGGGGGVSLGRGWLSSSCDFGVMFVSTGCPRGHRPVPCPLTQNACHFFGPFASTRPSESPQTTLCPLQSCNLGSLAAYFYWIRLCYLPLFRHVSFLRPRPHLLFISCHFRALGPVLDTKEILRRISLEATVTEGGGDRRDGRSSTCHPRPVGWRWPGQGSCRKNFLRRDLENVLGDKDTDTRLVACECASRVNLCPRVALPLKTDGWQELGYRDV